MVIYIHLLFLNVAQKKNVLIFVRLLFKSYYFIIYCYNCCHHTIAVTILDCHRFQKKILYYYLSRIYQVFSLNYGLRVHTNWHMFLQYNRFKFFQFVWGTMRHFISDIIYIYIFIHEFDLNPWAVQPIV